MKITVDSKSFIDAAQWALKSFDSRDDRAFVALTATKNGTGSMAHANATSYFKSGFTVLSVDLDDADEGTIPMQGQYLTRLVGSLDPTGPSELDYENGTLTLTNKLGKFTVPTFKAKAPAQPELEILGDVDNMIYFDAVQRLSKVCSSDAGLFPILETVALSIDFENSKAALMATDRFAMAEYVIDFSASAAGAEALVDQSTLLIPYGMATLIAPTKGEVSRTDLVWEPSAKKFGYAFPDGRVALFALQEAEAINYKLLKDHSLKSAVNSVQVSTKDLSKAIGVIANLAWDETEVHWELSGEGLTVHDKAKTNKLTVETANNELEEPVSFKFSREVVNKIFSPLGTATTNVKWGGPKDPFVFEAVLEDGAVADNLFVLSMHRS